MRSTGLARFARRASQPLRRSATVGFACDDASTTSSPLAPGWVKKPAGDISATMARLAAVPDELLTAYARWDELSGLR